MPGVSLMRPVVSRVKLPQPGSGKRRVCDITAGSGTASGESVGGAVHVGLLPTSSALTTPASAPGGLPRRVRTPEVTVPTLSRSLRRSSSAPREGATSDLGHLSGIACAELKDGFQRPASAQDATAPEEFSFASEHSPGRNSLQDAAFQPVELADDGKHRMSLDRGYRASEASERLPLQLDQSSHDTASSVVTSPRKVVDDSGSDSDVVVSENEAPAVSALRSSFARSQRSVNLRDSRGSSGENDAVVNDGEATDMGGSESGLPPALPQKSPVRRSSLEHSKNGRATPELQPGGVPNASAHRSHSEPPRRDGRLSQLVGEVTRHLEVELPDSTDARAWLDETAQLEFFAEEMRRLISDHDSRELPRGGHGLQPERNAPPKREVSVLRGDKDLRWARQQMRCLEKEHSQLVGVLRVADPAVQQQLKEELQILEQALDAEQRRQKQLEIENRNRGRSLARAVGADGSDGDGNTRALQQIERLDAELGVWRVKNASLQKQVDEAQAQLRRAQERRELIDVKAQQVAEDLENDEMQARIAEQRAHDERLKNEEADLRHGLAELQEARKRTIRNQERASRERARELADLKSQCSELDARRARLEILERQLRRQLRQQQHGSVGGSRQRSTSPQQSPRPYSNGRIGVDNSAAVAVLASAGIDPGRPHVACKGQSMLQPEHPPPVLAEAA